MKIHRPLSIMTVCLVVTTFAAPSPEPRAANVLGPANAPVIIEYFSDMQCPQCARYEPVVKSLKVEFGDKVRLVLRHFPLDTHGNAMLAACAAEAAANQGKFWQMVEALYKTQWIWGRAPAPRIIITEQAKNVGLDLDQFQKDWDSTQCRERISADQVYGHALGLKSMPAVLINGVNVPNSEFSEDGFRAAIKAALAKAGQ